MKHLYIFLSSIVFFSACNLDDDGENFFTDCNGNYPVVLTGDWGIVEIEYTPDLGSVQVIDSTHCVEDLCVEFDLNFKEDDSYEFNYSLPFKRDDASIVDTLVKMETGTYRIDFCYSETQDAMIWTGEVIFDPSDAEEYKLAFGIEPEMPLILEGVKEENGKIDFLLFLK